jgi:hypothetical protein
VLKKKKKKKRLEHQRLKSLSFFARGMSPIGSFEMLGPLAYLSKCRVGMEVILLC